MKKSHRFRRLTQILLVSQILCLTSQVCNAQYNFLQGIGVFAGETSSRDRYKNGYPLDFKDDPTFLHAYPPSHNSTERESWSVGVYLEMLKSHDWRWVSEIDYCNKGAKEEDEIVNAIANTTTSATNKYGNIQWNNYLKRWVDLGFRFRTYIMFGVRAEYTMIKSTPAYNYVSGSARRITGSPDVGIGAEFHLKGHWNLFVEEHYNPDVLPVYNKDKVKLWNRTWETRVGVIYRFKSGIGSVDMNCNAPRYHGR